MAGNALKQNIDKCEDYMFLAEGADWLSHLNITPYIWTAMI